MRRAIRVRSTVGSTLAEGGLAGRDEFCQHSGKELVGAGSHKPKQAEHLCGVAKSDHRLLCSLSVSTQAFDGPVVCDDWAALKDAIQGGQTLAYEFDGRELHIWRGSPNHGDRCLCRKRTWT